MKKLSIFTGILLHIVVNNYAYADELFYVSAGYGQTTYDTGITNLTGSAKLEDETDSSKVLVGFNVGFGFIAEAYYTNLGEVILTAENGDTYQSNGTTITNVLPSYKSVTETEGYGINLLYKIGLPIGSVYAKAGVLYWSWELEATSGGTVIGTASDSGTDVLVGAGVEFGIAPFTSVRLEYEQFEIDGDDVTTMALGIVVGF